MLIRAGLESGARCQVCRARNEAIARAYVLKHVCRAGAGYHQYFTGATVRQDKLFLCLFMTNTPN